MLVYKLKQRTTRGTADESRGFIIIATNLINAIAAAKEFAGSEGEAAWDSPQITILGTAVSTYNKTTVIMRDYNGPTTTEF